MQPDSLLHRVHELERELTTLRTEIERRSSPAAKNRFQRSAARFGRAAVAHWTLFSFLFALGTAVFVKYRFGIDFLENYRTLATTRNLSSFYQAMGDRLIQAQEWRSAEEYFEKAIQVYPNNVEAQYGIVKAQVFLPPKGERWTAPEVVAAKLDYLLHLFPDDYQVYFLRGQEYEMRFEPDSARIWYAQALARRPNFSAAYLSLGYLDMQAGDVESATANFEAAVRTDPRSVIALNNLGFASMVRLRFEDATRHLEASFRGSPRALTALNLGDAERFSGNPQRALEWHKVALRMLEDPQMDSAAARYIGHEWTFNFMPLLQGDTATIRKTLLVSTPERRRALAHFALSVDQALLGDRSSADRELLSALRLDSAPDLVDYLVSNLHSVRNLTPISFSAQEWLSSRAAALRAGRGRG